MGEVVVGRGGGNKRVDTFTLGLAILSAFLLGLFGGQAYFVKYHDYDLMKGCAENGLYRLQDIERGEVRINAIACSNAFIEDEKPKGKLVNVYTTNKNNPILINTVETKLEF